MNIEKIKIALIAIVVIVVTIIGCKKEENKVVTSEQKGVKQQKYFFEGGFDNIWDEKTYHYDMTRGICFNEIIVHPEQRDFYYEFVQYVTSEPTTAIDMISNRYREFFPELDREFLEQFLYQLVCNYNIHYVVNEEINREFLIATPESFYEPGVDVFTVFQFRVLSDNEDIIPFQYAIYEEHLLELLENVRLSLNNHPEWEERGYYTMKLDNDISQISYGFIVEGSPYFDPSIFDYSLEEIANTMSKAETDHWINELISLFLIPLF